MQVGLFHFLEKQVGLFQSFDFHFFEKQSTKVRDQFQRGRENGVVDPAMRKKERERERERGREKEREEERRQRGREEERE